MVSFRNLALTASAIIGLTSAAPTLVERRDFVPGKLNNTQEFYIRMTVTDGDTTHNGWYLQTYHTGAGMADPVFFPTVESASRAFLNGTNLQFDSGPFPFSANGLPGDTNYARWEPVDITAGYGSGGWVNGKSEGLKTTSEEYDGWIVCEWFHGVNAPQLFQMIKGFDAPAYTIPSSCARVLLFPQWI